MKPSNFPERKNQRRKDALARLANSTTQPPRPYSPDKEALALHGAIVKSARDVRTKKHGTKHARQAAWARGL